VLNYGSKYPELVGQIISSNSHSSTDLIELENELHLKHGTLFKWTRTDEANPTELSYEPLARYTALAKQLRSPRGTKSTEHLAILRTSDPAFGSLAPRKERPNATELSYEPLARYTALAKQLRSPRGTKSVAHLRELRTNDPTYGSLAPASSVARIREWAAKFAPVAGWLELSESDEAATSSSSEGSADRSEQDGRLRQTSPGRLPRILSTEVLSAMDDESEYDDLSDLTPSPRYQSVWRPPAPKFNPAYGFDTMRGGARPRERRASVESDDGSEYSNARTERERPSVERSSNDTIASFLDDTDVRSSGEWSDRSADLSSFLLPNRNVKMATKQARGAATKVKLPIASLAAGSGSTSAAGKLPPAVNADNVPVAFRAFAAGWSLLKEDTKEA